MIKHWIRGALTVAALAGAGSAMAETKLLFSTFFPQTHPIIAKVMVPWMKDVEAATNGRVKVEMASASLAPPPGQMDMVQKGVADIALQYTGVVPKRLQPELMTELPGTTGSSAAMSRALWETHQKYFAKDDRYKGTELLSLFVFPTQHFFCMKECFTTIEQFRSAKIATTPGTAARQYGALTSGIVAGPAVRYFEVVSKGIVDGYGAITAPDIYSFNLAPSTAGMLQLKELGTAGSFALLMNEGKWKSLPAADREAIAKLSGAAFTARMAEMDKADEEALKKMAAGGIKISEVNPKLLAELRKAYAFLDEEWIKDASARGIDAKAALQFYRDQLRK